MKKGLEFRPIGCLEVSSPKNSPQSPRPCSKGENLTTPHVYFPSGDSQTAYDEGWSLVTLIKQNFIQNLDQVTWMDNVTKSRALEKANKMGLNLGSPKTYHIVSYNVSSSSYFNNSGLAYRGRAAARASYEPVRARICGRTF